MNDLEKLFELLKGNEKLRDIVTNKDRIVDVLNNGISPALCSLALNKGLLTKIPEFKPVRIGGATGTVYDKAHFLSEIEKAYDLILRTRNTLFELYGFMTLSDEDKTL